MTNYILNLRERDVGGSVTSGSLWRPVGDTDEQWGDHLADITVATRGNRVLVLLHGYNNDYKVGRLRLTRYMNMLAGGGYTGVMLATLWPGDGWAKALTYPFEGRDADDTADSLFKWLITNVDATARISFVAHSLGSRVAMNTAQQLVRQQRGPALDRICLMAPAIDNDCLGRVGKTCYKDATLAADRIAVLASEEDLVLRFAYPLGDLTQTIFYGERWGRALGRTGPAEREPTIVTRIEPVPKSSPPRDIDHGDYLDVDVDHPGQTIAESEKFLIAFLEKVEKPVWPAQRR
ncbi:MAG: alpha/beta fold hydrolase [Gammaproteobacteria bacterium]|nr:alpha/beta fold hydrolase [Gammaproteobacteria bacterium]